MLAVVDWDAEELGFSDKRRLWTRRTHVHHVLDTVLLYIRTTPNKMKIFFGSPTAEEAIALSR